MVKKKTSIGKTWDDVIRRNHKENADKKIENCSIYHLVAINFYIKKISFTIRFLSRIILYIKQKTRT